MNFFRATLVVVVVVMAGCAKQGLTMDDLGPADPDTYSYEITNCAPNTEAKFSEFGLVFDVGTQIYFEVEVTNHDTTSRSFGLRYLVTPDGEPTQYPSIQTMFPVAPGEKGKAHVYRSLKGLTPGAYECSIEVYDSIDDWVRAQNAD